MDKKLEYELNLKDHFRKTMLGAEDATKKLDGTMNRLGQTATRIGSMIAGAFAIDRIFNFGRAVVLSTAAMTSFQNTIIAASRSEGEGRANLVFLNTQIDRLGLNLHAAQEGYRIFSGSVMGTNIQGAKSNKVFRQVSEATTILGLSSQQTEKAFLALGQMISKGIVQAEELRGQLGDALPGAFQIGARAMGMTSAQLGQAMKDGLINAEEFVVKFGDELEKTFGAKLGNATHSLQANLNRMDNEWERLKVNIGNSQTGIINGTISWAGRMLKEFNKVVGTTNDMSAAFEKFGAKDFNFFQQKGSMLSGILPSFMHSKVREAEKDYEYRQKLINNASGNKSELLGLKSGFLLEREQLSKRFANKKLGSEDYKRNFALISTALEMVQGSLTANNNDPMKGAAGTPPPSIGSPIDVSGARPQNINIHVDKLGDIILQGAVIKSDADINELLIKLRRAMSKEWLELLNDANQMANR